MLLRIGAPVTWTIFLMANDSNVIDPDSVVLNSRSQHKVPFPCHSHGMVGFIKELVDEQVCRKHHVWGVNEQFRSSNFESLLITPGVVFVSKMMPTLTASPNPVPAGRRARQNDHFVEQRRRKDLCFGG